MFLSFYVRLTDKDRGPQSNFYLGCIMALIAGAVNAGGFLAVRRYTSHMTGIISGMADDFILSDFTVVLSGFVALLSFVAGATTTALFINWTRRRRLHSEYALSLALEAVLLLFFGLLGANLNVLVEVFVPTTVLLLCFIMGLQNAIMTKVSRSEIRTTHMTGVVTDIGIELGRLLYWNNNKRFDVKENVRANRQKLKALTMIFINFLIGGVLGALAFKRFGYFTTVPIAMFLVLMGAPPIVRDLMNALGFKK
jgi:uncharacterized membrane protein YoaK (UPF0700 family)